MPFLHRGRCLVQSRIRLPVPGRQLRFPNLRCRLSRPVPTRGPYWSGVVLAETVRGMSGNAITPKTNRRNVHGFRLGTTIGIVRSVRIIPNGGSQPKYPHLRLPFGRSALPESQWGSRRLLPDERQPFRLLSLQSRRRDSITAGFSSTALTMPPDMKKSLAGIVSPEDQVH